MALKTYEVINTVVTAIQTDHWPNLNAIARSVSGGNTTVHQPLIDYGKQCVLVGCEQQLSGNFKQLLAVFKAARLFHLIKSVH